MAAAEPVIAVSDLTRRFGARAALSSVTLRIPRGGVHVDYELTRLGESLGEAVCGVWKWVDVVKARHAFDARK